MRQSAQATRRDYHDTSYYRARNRDGGRAARGNGEYQVRDRRAAARNRAPQSSLSSAGARRSTTGRHSAVSPSVQGFPLIPVIIIALVVIALAVFGISRCVGSMGQTDANQADGTAAVMDESQATVSDNPYLPTPYIAKGGGIKLHSAVAANELTEILIHNASYSYADALSTKLVEATNVDVMAAHGTGRVADEQPTGDNWLTGEFIRCYRDGNAGPKMSAIDCGGPAGATVYAPVSGTVVKVKQYQLYNKYPDIQVHIQPEGRSDLDVVLIHLENAQVKEGDQVIGGVTPLAQIRDVYAYIGEEMQLKQYTADGDNGNHTHIQINDATNSEYHGLDD